MAEQHDYTAGSVIEYAPFGGGTRRVRVISREEDIKNGEPGFDGELLPDDADHAAGDSEWANGWNTVWGYDRQITRVIS